ncbi:MAG: glycosyltransferase family 2 protein [Fimbriimonadales bacterium]|nr:glycosyltransferase family 2 protein [Fimbriimonadales bacterium]
MRPARVAVLIPARNEADRIGETICALRDALPNAPIVVLDDGSVDGTAEQAAQAGAQVVRVGVHLPRTGSKGDALWLGWQLVEAEVYLFLDADLGRSARHAPRLLTPVQLRYADMTIGVPPPAGRTGGFGIVARLARIYLHLRTGRRFRAPLSGQRAIRRELLTRLRGFAPGYGLELGLTLDACLLGACSLEIEAPFEHRAYGRTLKGFLHRARQLRDVCLAMIGVRRHFTPRPLEATQEV